MFNDVVSQVNFTPYLSHIKTLIVTNKQTTDMGSMSSANSALHTRIYDYMNLISQVVQI